MPSALSRRRCSNTAAPIWPSSARIAISGSSAIRCACSIAKSTSKLAAAAPKSLDYLCDNCRAHFATVRELLTDAGVPYVVNPRLVRGLDYYTRTTFEVISNAVGAQSAVVGGRPLRRPGRGAGRRGGRRYRLRDRRRSHRAGAGRRPVRSRGDAGRGRDRDGRTRSRAVVMVREMRAAGLRVELALARTRAQGAAAPRRENRCALRGDHRRQRTRARRRPATRSENQHAKRSRAADLARAIAGAKR